MIIAAQIFAASLNKSALYNCILLLAKEQPAVRFILLADKGINAPNDLPENIEFKHIAVPPSRPRHHLWYSYTLPALFKKYGVTHFISETGALSLRSSIPQYLLIGHNSFLLKKPILTKLNDAYIKRFFPKFLKHVAGVFTTENFVSESLAEKYPEAKEKTIFIGHGLAPVYKPMDWEQKDKLLEDFSEGTEYFVAECSAITKTNILSLLKAFSLFKKRQKSGMKLVLLLKGIQIEECIKDFHLYKYRDDVKLVPFTTEEDYATILAASYSAIYLPAQIVVENTGLNVLASGSPLITFESAPAQAIYGGAALYAELSEKSIAENMMLLYKDESLRKELIEKGLSRSEVYNWTSSAKLLWQSIATASSIKS